MGDWTLPGLVSLAVAFGAAVVAWGLRMSGYQNRPLGHGLIAFGSSFIAATVAWAISGCPIMPWLPLGFLGAILVALVVAGFTAPRQNAGPPVTKGETWTTSGISWETDTLPLSPRDGLSVTVCSELTIQPMRFRILFKDIEGLDNYFVRLMEPQKLRHLRHWSQGEPDNAEFVQGENHIQFSAPEPALRPGLQLVFNIVPKGPLKVVEVQRLLT